MHGNEASDSGCKGTEWFSADFMLSSAYTTRQSVVAFQSGEKNSMNESVFFVLFYCPTENRNGNTKTNPSTLVPSLQRTQYWSTAGGFSQGVKIEQAYGEEKKKCPSARVSKIRNADWCVQISWNWAGTKTTGKLDQVYTQIREYSLF